MEIILEYEDDLIHGGDKDTEARDWFYMDILLGKQGGLSLHSNEIGDTLGEVEVLSIKEIKYGS